MSSINPIQPFTRSSTQVATQVFDVDGVPSAYLLRGGDWPQGLSFVTPDETFIQAGTWRYDAGTDLAAHAHKEYERVAMKTQETVYIKQGSLKAILYNKKRNPVNEVVLHTGDLLVITECGHGYEILEDDTQVLEVKNGPFVSVEHDKEKF